MNLVLLDEQERDFENIIFRDGSWIWRVRDLKKIYTFENNEVFEFVSKLFQRNKEDRTTIDFVYKYDPDLVRVRTFRLVEQARWESLKEEFISINEIDIENLFFDLVMNFSFVPGIDKCAQQILLPDSIVSFHAFTNPHICEWWNVFR